MPEQDAGTLTTLTLTLCERRIIDHALTMLATMQDALGDVKDAKETLEVWERVSPDYES